MPDLLERLKSARDRVRGNAAGVDRIVSPKRLDLHLSQHDPSHLRTRTGRFV